MTAKEYFQRAREAQEEISRLEAVSDRFREMGERITSHWGATPPSGGFNSSRVESSALGIYEAEQGVLSQIEAYAKTVIEAEKVISLIRQSRFRQILTLHYIVGLSLAETGTKLKYEDKNSIYRAHGWALAEAQKILDKMT